MFKLTMLLTFLLLIISVFFTVISRLRRRDLMDVFRAYNEKKDLAVLSDWIQERHSALRLTNALEYLLQIEEEQLAVDLFTKLPFDAWPSRTIRIYAIKAFRVLKREEAMTLAARLLEDCPNDDSVLEIYNDTFLLFKRYDEVEKVLLPRLEKKGKGTVFARQHGQLLAARGEKERALEILGEVVKRDYMLYKNTMAPASKKLIYEQFVAGQEIYDRIKEDREDSEDTEDK